MRTATVTTALALGFTAILTAQTASSDEQQIRALIAQFDSGQRQGMGTKDVIFWTGAYKRPTIGNEQGEEVAGAGQVSARVPGTNRAKTSVVRIEVAKSGDLAYEFSNVEVSLELKDGKKMAFPNSTLRVWKKEAGQWKIAAHFARPHEQ
jgi:ketosteroid isomerase-like protein